MSLHTLGPMRAAYLFATELRHSGVLEHVARVGAELFGSLGRSGDKHGIDKAVLLGLLGEEPERVAADAVEDMVDEVLEDGVLPLLQLRDLPFEADRDLVFHRRESLPGDANGMRFTAFNEAGEAVYRRVYYSSSDGAIVDEAFLEGDAVPQGNQ